MQHTHTSIQTHTHTHTRAVPHTHVRCRCRGRHTETEASLITTPMPSQHLPHSRPRFRVWREEQAASAWASAVQAACPSAPSSMSSLPAIPAPPMCTHTPTHISHCIPVAHTSHNTHSTPQQGGRRHRARHSFCPSEPLSLSPNPLCTISEVRQERGRALLRPAPCLLTPSSYTLPHGHSTMRHAPSLAHACLTPKVQRGEGGALGHALRCQHSKALGAHATTCPTTPRQHMQTDEERNLSLSCDLS